MLALFKGTYYSHWISLKSITIHIGFKDNTFLWIATFIGELWESAICLLNKKRCAFELPVQKSARLCLRMGPRLLCTHSFASRPFYSTELPSENQQWVWICSLVWGWRGRMKGREGMGWDGMGWDGMGWDGGGARAGQMKEIAGVGTAGTLRDWVDWWLTVWRIIPNEIDLRIPLWTHNYSRLRSWIG